MITARASGSDANKRSLLMERSLDIKDFVRQQYDNSETSDFVITDRLGCTIYVHTLVMRTVPYFDCYLNSLVGLSAKPDTGPFKKSILVESVNIARYLVKYIYYKNPEIPNGFALKDFISLVNLSKEWLLFDSIRNDLFRSALRYKDTPDAMQIYYLADLYLHFHDYGKDSVILFDPIIKYFRKNHDDLPVDVLDYDFFNKMFNDTTKIDIIIRNGAIVRLNKPNKIIALDSLSHWVIQYYKTTIKLFSEKQIKIILSGKYYYL